ncbi:Uma2 family endonuclease [Streptomyces albofaciens JCM 4342]|uniref:Uma2 family endonuclease n=1 Tax=Streptomyces albofaciens TaxID=66866 RepID=UPI000AFE0A80|nr:Uma2 family endonuclease [Streptomyces albofaciens]KAA6221996.1 Uma2 family endonuclease [Streptomyces albofaciens JCM 4342]
MTEMLERPTIIDVPHGSAGFQELCRTVLSMDVPDGYRAEIIGGKIVMSPWSLLCYTPIMQSIEMQLRPHVPAAHRIAMAPNLVAFPEQERCYGPDLYAAAASAFKGRRRGHFLDREALSLAVELTSPSTRDQDWKDKLRVYGTSGVPVYLLLDMLDEMASVFWEPSEEGYVKRDTVAFGETLHIPAPFDCQLDTADFLDALRDDEDE